MAENDGSGEYCPDELQTIFEMLLEYKVQDEADKGDQAIKFLLSFPPSCRAQLQWYVLQQYGEKASDDLYNILKKSPEFQKAPTEVTKYVDSLFGE